MLAWLAGGGFSGVFLKARRKVVQAPSNIGHWFLLHRATVIFGVLAFLASSSKDAMAIDACGFGPSANSVMINALADSTTYFSIPFTRTPAFCGLVAGIAGNTITVTDNLGAPPAGAGLAGLTPGPDSYYVVITSGVKEGAGYTTNAAVAMTVATVTVNPPPDSCENLAGVVVGGVGVGDQIAIIPYWTLTTVWPGTPPANITGGGSAGASTDIELFNPVTQAFDVFYYKNAGIGGVGWRKTTSASINAANQSIPPYQTIVLLQHMGAPNLAFALPPAGGVAGYEVKYKTRACLYAPPAGNPWFNFVSNYHYYPPAFGQALAPSLLQNGITASRWFCFPPGIKDRLLVYDNTVPGINKAPKDIYFYNFCTSHWRRVPLPINADGVKVFEAGTGTVILRVAGFPSPLIWVDPP